MGRVLRTNASGWEWRWGGTGWGWGIGELDNHRQKTFLETSKPPPPQPAAGRPPSERSEDDGTDRPKLRACPGRLFRGNLPLPLPSIFHHELASCNHSICFLRAFQSTRRSVTGHVSKTKRRAHDAREKQPCGHVSHTTSSCAPHMPPPPPPVVRAASPSTPRQHLPRM